MKLSWWKITSILLVSYSVIGGLLMPVPRIAIVNETIRNQYYHVTMWFALLIILTVSLIFSIRFLITQKMEDDDVAVEFSNLGFLFGILGLSTGMVWANFTWGDWWSGDVKQNMTLVALLIYAAYLVLRNSMENDFLRAKVSAVYNIFAFSSLIPLLVIVPRMYDSLHPGSGGNPGFKVYDMDFWLRIVFYPSVIGWTLLGTWIATMWVRLRRVERSGNKE
ncbi:MAG: ABC transporter permease [Bacteroidetes bacterium RIFCSPLOWO2_02_FULL_36_8]|nr:MAG: ABC transporter permease [Bacteroidetes bacterium RIFCSPLOWO2_02_FULL_36_8]OFY70171.1 MAG: ABC transporter permease [Bacteroidetes bacterium RIFCSPLOWO2_12_FULL_37_12]